MRVKVGEANWTEPMAQGIDFHEFYLHRGVNFWRLVNYRLGFFRPKVAYTGGVRITSEDETSVNAAWAAPHFGQGYHPGVGAHWPRHVWWRRLAGGPQFRGGEPPLARYRGVQHNVELPSKIRVMIGACIDLRWMVPVDDHDTRVWTFTLVRKPRNLVHVAWQALWYHRYRKPAILIATNEQEDLVVFKRERLNLKRPQKLGPLDVGLIYFRRHLAQRARDYQRLGHARGALPTREDGDVTPGAVRISRRRLLQAGALGGVASALGRRASVTWAAAPPADWPLVIAAAKKEGKVVVNTFPGDGYKRALKSFTQAYPDIKLEHTGLHSQDFAPRILQERQASLYTWDVATIPTSTALQVLRPAGVWDPVRPAIVLPEVTDDAAVWEGGFERGFALVKDRALCLWLRRSVRGAGHHRQSPTS